MRTSSLSSGFRYLNVQGCFVGHQCSRENWIDMTIASLPVSNYAALQAVYIALKTDLGLNRYLASIIPREAVGQYRYGGGFRGRPVSRRHCFIFIPEQYWKVNSKLVTLVVAVQTRCLRRRGSVAMLVFNCYFKKFKYCLNIASLLNFYLYWNK